MANAYDLCSLAWGEREGYVFLSIRNPELKPGDEGYWKDLSFKWPEQKRSVVQALLKAGRSDNDVYWAPAVYSTRRRAKDNVLPTDLLWADLDEADPKAISPQLRPTAAWETSPGRWQAIWKLDTTFDAELQTQLNKRMTYAVGADKGGWDLTQVLRIPGTLNHKYEGTPQVKLEYMNGHVANAIQVLNDLPEVERGRDDPGTTKVDEQDIPNRKVLLRRLRLPGRAKSLLRVRPGQESGDRSERLWELECILAEFGCEEGEIVSLVRPTGWNKFSDRPDEIERLFTEARKAIAHSAPVERPTVSDSLMAPPDEFWEEEQEAAPVSWEEFDRDHRPVQWLVAETWAKGEVGFISGLPKAYKSWIALDLAVSLASGTRFLGTYASKVTNVLLIQEEDPKVVMQDRLVKVAANKGLITVSNTEKQIKLRYALPDNLMIVSNQGFTINEEYLEMLTEWITQHHIEFVILDPLMMMAEGVDEFKALEMMNGVLKPLKRLRSKTGAAICVVHHHTKGSTQTGAQAMYGSVALWAWEEAGLHLSVSGIKKVVAERFSKHTLLPPIGITISDTQEAWDPNVGTPDSAADILDLIAGNEHGLEMSDLEGMTGMKDDTLRRHLKKYEEDGRLEKIGKKWRLKRGVS